MADQNFQDVRLERAEFDGVIIAVLSYGALVMLYIQLLRVLLTRPKRGKVFWGIVVYSGILFALASIAAGGKIKVAEYTYVTSRLDPTTASDPPGKVFLGRSNWTINVMSQICTTLVPWVGDVLMLYRVMVVWNYKWWLLTLPLPIYLARIAMSIPLLILDTHQAQPNIAAKTDLYGNVFYALCVALNIMVSFLITLRLVTMRKKLEIALGRLHASFYTSVFTVFVESGAFFTLWGIVYVATRSQKHWSADVFLQPYSYVISITRMLIVLRMAQNRAWSKDIVSAASSGIMDWEVSSTHSIPLHEAPRRHSGQMKIKSPGSSSASTHTLG